MSVEMAPATIARTLLFCTLLVSFAIGVQPAEAKPPKPPSIVHGIFDDANILNATSFATMIDRIKPLGLHTVMLTNGSVNRLDDLLTVSDAKGVDVYAAPAVELNAQWWAPENSAKWGQAGSLAMVDSFLPRLGRHRSLRGWYLTDEPPAARQPAASWLAWAFKQRDPGRSRFIVSAGLDSRANVYDPARMTPFVADVYPFAWSDPPCDTGNPFGYQISYTGYLSTLQSMAGKPAGVPLWVIGQTHGAQPFNLREPSREEVRAQYRLARQAGATGMFWFIYTSQQGWRGLDANPDLLDEIGRIAQGVSAGPSC